MKLSTVICQRNMIFIENSKWNLTVFENTESRLLDKFCYVKVIRRPDFFQTGEIIWRNIILIVQFLLPCFNSIRDDSIGLNLLGLQWKTRFWNFQTEIMFSQRRGEMTKKSSWSSRFKNFTWPHFSPIPRKLRASKNFVGKMNRHITKWSWPWFALLTIILVQWGLFWNWRFEVMFGGEVKTGFVILNKYFLE